MKTIPNYAAYAAQHIYTRQHPRLQRRRARSSSASARTRSRSTSASIFDLLNVPGAADFTPAEAAFLLDNSKKDAGTTTSTTPT